MNRCKSAGLRIVAGGPLFQSEHEQFEDVDHFVLNEAELTLPAFLEDLANGRAQRIYSAEGFPDLSETPNPMWELLDKIEPSVIAMNRLVGTYSRS